MKSFLRIASLLLAVQLSLEAQPAQDLNQYVNPFCGTTHDGGLYPGASAPFGMIQWSPDSGTRPTLAGYNYRDSVIYGFSLEHLSGGGSYYGGNFSFMPLISGEGLAAAPAGRYAFKAPFSHADETASPGRYAVTLSNGIKIELTASARAGCGRFTFPKARGAALVINAGSNINGVSNSMIQIDPSAQAVSGSATGGHFLGHPNICTTYFYVEFDRPFARYGTWRNAKLSRGGTNASGKSAGAYLTFDTGEGRTVGARVAISYVSVENAKANLDLSPRDFDATAIETESAWNRWMNKIQVSGGNVADLRTFYSMLYHVLLSPTICSDANGQYRGYDGQVHTTERGRDQYGNFSGWDIYRSECQLLAMIAPKEASDMAQSLLIDYQQGGAFPRWGLTTEDSGVMDGDPAAPMIADFYAFGARAFDAKSALAGLLRAATNPAVQAPRNHIRERDGLAEYLSLGYVPEDVHGIWNSYGNVSLTLEYASADFAISQMASALGDDASARLMRRHAQNWRHLFNPRTGYLQMRRRDGTWAPGFTNNVISYDHNQAYQEGTAAQYVWMVPFDYGGLSAAMGGREVASARLDVFFSQLNAGIHSAYAYMGNEPCVETPWIYCFLGQPYKTQQWVRRIMTELYSSAPDGYPGNDDLGEMSSWYVFAALGMYPELPGSDILVLGSPLFETARIRLPEGDVMIDGGKASRAACFVQKLSLNGHAWNKPWLRFSEIERGGKLVYRLGVKPNKRWGSAPADAPPSFGSPD